MRVSIGLIIILLFAALLQVKAQSFDEVEFSVITAEQGDQVYDQFGHSAIRMFIPGKDLGQVYNYGIFDSFNEDFAYEFAKGNLNYMLARYAFEPFLQGYIEQDRRVTEQVLNLTLDEKMLLFEALETNNLPENREYLYDYFYNNCATKIPYLLDSLLGDRIEWHEDKLLTGKSIRQLCDDYLGRMPWLDFGIDLGLGVRIDGEAIATEHMFLPDYVMKGLDNAVIIHNGVEEPLVKEKIELVIPPKGYNRPDIAGSISPLSGTSILLLLVLVMTALDYQKGWKSYWFDALLFLLYGLGGCLLAYLWFFTLHQASAWNMNILWLSPLHLIVPILLLLVSKSAIIKNYFFLTALISAILIVGWLFVPQQLHIATLPLIAALMIRSGAIYFKERQILFVSKTG